MKKIGWRCKQFFDIKVETSFEILEWQSCKSSVRLHIINKKSIIFTLKKSIHCSWIKLGILVYVYTKSKLKYYDDLTLSIYYAITTTTCIVLYISLNNKMSEQPFVFNTSINMYMNTKTPVSDLDADVFHSTISQCYYACSSITSTPLIWSFEFKN